MKTEYPAHYRASDDTYQTLSEHSQAVAKLSEFYCQVPLLKKTARLAGLTHDIGKINPSWNAYFEASIKASQQGASEEVVRPREKEDHSTLGGAVLASIKPAGSYSEIVEDVVYMHHGLADCVSLKDSSYLFRKRREKFPQASVEMLQDACGLSPEDVLELYREARADFQKLTKQIMETRKLPGYSTGNSDFYLGMCHRLLLSCLMDADWRDTADFMDNRETRTGLSPEETVKFWEAGIRAIDQKTASFERKSSLDDQKALISQQCKEAAGRDENLFRLAVPTGAGKTLSSIRFAMHRAKEREHRHIFYIAPFKSILDQNAGVIRDVLKEAGMIPDDATASEVILEHHGDVVSESWEGAENPYERLIENWDEVPIIVTTAVQFFHTLFKEKRSNIRRFHSLANSVIILDEVQALPIRLVHMFNLTVNFLTGICGSTMVLCTATQPLFDRLPVNRMFPLADMTGGLSAYEKYFRRVEYHDLATGCTAGLTVEEAASLVRQKAEQYGGVLMIVNTRLCARKIYQKLKGTVKGKLFHLSNSMCPIHRMEVLEKIRDAKGEPVVCIATCAVEAGVDLSFPCVIRSLAGLDNLIQAAGRSNRYGGLQMGQVFLVKMSEEMERLSSLPDIRKAQKAMESLLHKFHENPDAFDGRLDSWRAIEEYYSIYFYGRQGEMSYTLDKKILGVEADLVDLLSLNLKFVPKEKRATLNQAFATAGKQFQALDDVGGRDVIVVYGNSEGLLNELQGAHTSEERKQKLKRLQQYTVKISEGMARRLGSALYAIGDERILVLRREYYDQETGVQEEPGEMEFLSF